VERGGRQGEGERGRERGGKRQGEGDRGEGKGGVRGGERQEEGVWNYLSEFWAGVCKSKVESLTPFQIKMYDLSHPDLTWSLFQKKSASSLSPVGKLSA